MTTQENSNLIVCGYNEYHQHGRVSEKSDNKIFINPPYKKPSSISSLLSYSIYYSHSIFIMKNGRAYTIGNGHYIENNTEPIVRNKKEIIIQKNGHKFKFVSAVCGMDYNLYIIKLSNGFKKLIYVNFSNGNKRQAINIEDRQPLALFGGSFNSAAIDDEGRIIFITSSYVNIKSLPFKERAVSVACCDTFMIALGETGKVFYSNLTKNFDEVDDLKDKTIIDISGTSQRCYAVSNDGKVFMSDTPTYSIKFNELKSLSRYKIVAAYAGYKHSLFQTKKGKILSLGKDEYGELLLDSFHKDAIIPTETCVESGASFCIAGKFLSTVFVGKYVPPNIPNKRIEFKDKNYSTKEDQMEIVIGGDESEYSSYEESYEESKYDETNDYDNDQNMSFDFDQKLHLIMKRTKMQEDKIKELESIIIKNHAYEKDYEEIKKQYIELSNIIPSLKEKIANLKDENKKLEQKNILDSELIKQYKDSIMTQNKLIAELNKKIEINKNETDIAEECIENYKKLSKSYDEISKECDKINKSYKIALNEIKEKNEIIKKYEKLNKEIQKKSDEILRNFDEKSKLVDEYENIILEVQNLNEKLIEENKELERQIGEIHKMPELKTNLQFGLENLKNQTNNLIKLEPMKNIIDNYKLITEDEEENYEILKKTGNGATSDAYIILDKRTMQVLCKKIVKPVDEKEAFNKVKNALKEYEVLVRMNHPCICHAIGYNLQEKMNQMVDDSDDPPKTISLYIEYFPYKLKDYLSNKLMNNTLKTKIALDIAFGMMYIHNMGIIHRDLKIENIMLNSMLEAKIIDFDQCHVSDNQEITNSLKAEIEDSLTKGIGTLKYMSPEMANEEKYDSKTDVYSYGIVLYILFIGKEPNQNMKDKMDGKPLQFPIRSSYISEVCIKLIKMCTLFDKIQRPSFEQIIDFMHSNNFMLANDINFDTVKNRYQDLYHIQSEINSKQKNQQTKTIQPNTKNIIQKPIFKKKNFKI